MLYRFKSAQKRGRLGGSFCHGALPCDVPIPAKSIPSRARFYFTALGYKLNVELIMKEAKAMGQVLQVIRIKEPAKSRVAYRDKYQVAVLP